MAKLKTFGSNKKTPVLKRIAWGRELFPWYHPNLLYKKTASSNTARIAYALSW